MVSVVDITQRFRMVSVVGFFMVSVVAGNVFLWFPSLVFLWFPSRQETFSYGFRRGTFSYGFHVFLMVSVARFLVDSAVTGGSGIFECLE